MMLIEVTDRLLVRRDEGRTVLVDRDTDNLISFPTRDTIAVIRALVEAATPR